MEKYKLILGDCLEKLKKLPDNSIDSIVSDPPGGLNFMGKNWDSDKGGRDNWIAWMTEIMKECNRVIKPGGHALFWALPRTSYWTMMAIDNGGFYIVDVIEHIFGQGFPKSHNISKAIEKKLNTDLITEKKKGVGSNNTIAMNSGKGGKQIFNTEYNDLILQTQEAKKYNGWGTGLKPAHEEWILCRKPISEKTIADNVLKYGTGGLNIDDCRIGTSGGETHKGGFQKEFVGGKVDYENSGVDTLKQNNLGRFPSNFIHSGDDCIMEEFEKVGITKSSKRNPSNNKERNQTNIYSPGSCVYTDENSYSDTGTPARFFYNTSNICDKPYYKEKEQIDVWEKLQLLANNVELNSKIMNQIKEFIVQKNVAINQNKQQGQNVKNVETQLMKVETFIVALIVGLKGNIITKSTLQVILDYITESKNCSLTQNLANIVEIWGNIDTTQITQIPSILSGYVNLVTIKFIQEIERLELNQSTLSSMDTQFMNKQNCEIESRFVYVSKPSTKERNMGCDELEEKIMGDNKGHGLNRICGNCKVSMLKPEDCKCEEPNWILPSLKNNHPTIKSVKLMAYLITLITPENGIVLDPFMGSGTTGISALLLNKRFIGIEKEEDYFKIAETRIKSFEKYRQFIK